MNADRVRLLTDERFGLIELLEMERDGRRWADADHPRGIDRGHLTRRRDTLRAAVVACEVRHGR